MGRFKPVRQGKGDGHSKNNRHQSGGSDFEKETLKLLRDTHAVSMQVSQRLSGKRANTKKRRRTEKTKNANVRASETNLGPRQLIQEEKEEDFDGGVQEGVIPSGGTSVDDEEETLVMEADDEQSEEEATSSEEKGSGDLPDQGKEDQVGQKNEQLPLDDTCNEPKEHAEKDANTTSLLGLVSQETNHINNDFLELEEAFWHTNAGQEEMQNEQSAASKTPKNKKVGKKKKLKRKRASVEKHKPSEGSINKDAVEAATQLRDKFAEEERHLRDLDFDHEVSRIDSCVDDFIPDHRLNSAEYQKQRNILEHVENEKERLCIGEEKMREERSKREEIEAAENIQRVARGMLGRKYVGQVLAAGGINGYLEQESQKQSWRPVHDPATGDTWYYNTVTGERQWEIPLALGMYKKAQDELTVEIGRNHSALSRASSAQVETVATKFPPLSPTKTVGGTQQYLTASTPFEDGTTPSSGTLASTPYASTPSTSSQGFRQGITTPYSNSIPSSQGTRPGTTTGPRPMTGLVSRGSMGRAELCTRGGIFTRGSDVSGTGAGLSELPPLTPNPNGSENAGVADYGFPALNEGDDLDYLCDTDEQDRTKKRRTNTPGPEHKNEQNYSDTEEPDFDTSNDEEDCDEHKIDQQDHDEEGSVVDKSCFNDGSTPRFFLPDGTADVKLRDVIRNASNQTKFDSVSALMATMAKEEEAEQRKLRQKRRQRNSNPEFNLESVVACANLSNPQPRMVSALKLRKGGKKKKKNGKLNPANISKSNNAEEKEVDEPLGDTPPAIFNIAHSGGKASDIDHGIEQREEHDTTSITRDLKDLSEKEMKETCFLCWSSGDDMIKRCDEHQKNKQLPPGAGSVLTCANWNVRALQRKYRSEEIQERFAKANSSLRWDLNRKRFITVIQAKHPVYRALFDNVDAYNLRTRSKIKTMKWFKSVSDQIKIGQIKGEKAARKCSLLRAKETIVNNRHIRKFKETVSLLEPKPVVTMNTIMLKGVLNLEEGYLVMIPEANGPAKRIEFVKAPTSKPHRLYQPRKCSDIPGPKHGRVPPPSYAFACDEDRELVRQKTNGGSKLLEDKDHDSLKGTTTNVYMNVYMEGSWIERLAAHTAGNAVEKAIKEVRDQIPQVVKLRTKHPPACTSKYATFLRMDVSETEAMKLVGMPPALAILSQDVTTKISAQYGKFVVASKTSVAPSRKRYDSFHDEDGFLDPNLTFYSYEPPHTGSLGSSYEELASALNTRLPPTIICSSLIYENLEHAKSKKKHLYRENLTTQLKQAKITSLEYNRLWSSFDKEYKMPINDEEYKHYHGVNCCLQTGESEDVGFRRTAAVKGPDSNPVFATVEFVPSGEIAVSNSPGIRGVVTSKAGVDYPFCVPSTRELSLLDHFHLLMFTESAPNSQCCFTSLGRQDPGMFLMKNNTTEGLGVLEMRIYRSFGYFQTPHIEEYKTAEGVPYWYNRKTGDTFWEPPLIDMSAMDDDEDERPLVEDPMKALTKYESKKHSTTVGAKRKPPSQLCMRQHMLRDYEESPDYQEKPEEDDEFAREKKIADEKRMAQDKRFRERVGQVNIMKGTKPLLSLEEERRQTREQEERKQTLAQQRKQAQVATQSEDSSAASEADTMSTAKKTASGKHFTSSRKPRRKGRMVEESSSAISGSLEGENPHKRSHRGSTRTKKSNQQNDETQRLISTISNALKTVMEDTQGSEINSQDFLKLGVGLGLGLGLGKQQQSSVAGVNAHETDSEGEEETQDGSPREDHEQNSPRESCERTSPRESCEDEDDTAPSNAVLVVPTPRHRGPFSKDIEPTPTPDEEEDLAAKAAEEAARLHEESADLGSEIPASHEPAGEGKYWTAQGTAAAKSSGKILKSGVPLPEGFVNSVYKAHTAKQHVDYLPSIPNLNEARSVGVVKPRHILKDWASSGFDPWSDGKDLYTTSFIPSLFVDEGTSASSSSLAPFTDSAGLNAQKAEISEKVKLTEELEKLFSWCRHGKYEEIEDFFDDPDCNYPIDTKDGLGNTLLSIAAQNGNKRIAKLCLRRGADINTQNLNGQTVLHYCTAYGFNTLADYFTQKGADDSIVNADGLTCYEGLSLEDVENI